MTCMNIVQHRLTHFSLSSIELGTPGTVEYDWGRELLKWVAVVSMTIDHVGLIFFPEYIIFRVIGRLAFPLFAYLLVLGMKSTHNIKGYFNRLIFFAIISQIPYSLANEIQPWAKLNIFFTLILSLIMIHLIERGGITFIMPLIASGIIPMDYGVYGTTTVLLFYILGKDWKIGASIFVLINFLIAIFDVGYQPFAVVALPLILLHDWGKLKISRVKREGKHPQFRKYFFYAYYPLHLMILEAIKILI